MAQHKSAAAGLQVHQLVAVIANNQRQVIRAYPTGLKVKAAGYGRQAGDVPTPKHTDLAAMRAGDAIHLNDLRSHPVTVTQSS
jgi:hypothetical protein